MIAIKCITFLTLLNDIFAVTVPKKEFLDQSVIKFESTSGPVEVTRVVSTGGEVDVTWSNPKYEIYKPEGYVFNINDSNGSCETIISEELQDAGGYNCSKYTRRQNHVEGNIRLNLRPSSMYKVDIYSIRTNTTSLKAVFDIQTKDAEPSSQYLELQRLFEDLDMEDTRCAFSRKIMGTIVEISGNCRERNKYNLKCKDAETVLITVELWRDSTIFLVPFNISCGVDNPPRSATNLTMKYRMNTTYLYWNGTTEEEQRYIIFWMNKKTYVHRYVTLSQSSYLLDSVPQSSWSQICIASIDTLWRTGKYICTQQTFSLGAVEDILISSTNKDISVSWKVSKEEDITHHGYVVNVTNQRGLCVTTIINMKSHFVSVKNSCLFPRILRWTSLQPLKIEQLLPDTKYQISLSAIWKDTVGAKKAVMVVTKEEETVSNIRVSPRGSFMLVQFTPPRNTESLLMKYRLTVTLDNINMCTYRHTIMYDNVINTTSKMINIKGQTNCCQYLVEVTPIQVYGISGKAKGTSSMTYKPNMRSVAVLINTDVTFLSETLLKVFWKDVVEEDNCSDFGFMVESTNVGNGSDCRTWVISRASCTKLVKDLGGISSCNQRGYLKSDIGVVKDSLFLHGLFKASTTYKVKVWRISDGIYLVLNKETMYQSQPECFRDCYTSTYQGIRSLTTGGHWCLSWKNYTSTDMYGYVRSNLCHFIGSYPQCVYNVHGAITPCLINTCASFASYKCVSVPMVVSSRDWVNLSWPIPPIVYTTYISVLHNSDHDCLQYHLQEFISYHLLTTMTLYMRAFYLTCPSKSSINQMTHKVDFGGLQPNKQYNVYLIPVASADLPGDVRNVTVATTISDPIVPVNIIISKRGLNYLHFMWNTYNNIGNFTSVLENVQSKIRLSRSSSENVVEFVDLEICSKYCLYLTAMNLEGQNEWTDQVCTQTLGPTPRIIRVNGISSELSSNKVISWRYLIKDNCYKLYRVKYTIRSFNETFEKIINGTSVDIKDLRVNVVYEVRVRAETPAEATEMGDFGDYSQKIQFFTGTETPRIARVTHNVTAARKTVDVSWVFQDRSLGALFEFIVRFDGSGDKCLGVKSLICQLCIEPYKRKYLSTEMKERWGELLRCDKSRQEYYNGDREFFNTTVDNIPLDKAKMTIYGLNLMGSHRLFENNL